MNKLMFGDNLKMLRDHVADESIDLVYLDPPFNSKQNYNVLFRERDGSRSAAQIRAFQDTWQWDVGTRETYEDLVEKGDAVSQAMQAFHSLLGPSDMLAYLSMMAPRLAELHRVLKSTGSVFLHCDPTASHYLKVLMDAVFGPKQFLNEIIWRRTASHNSSKRFGPIHDTLLFYAKSSPHYFKRIFRPYAKGHVEAYFKKSDAGGRYWGNAIHGSGKRKGESGKPWKGFNPTAAGRHWAIPGRLIEALGIDPDLSVHEKLDALYAAGAIILPTKDDSEALPTYKQYLNKSLGMPIQDIWAYQPYTKGLLEGSTSGIDEDVRWLVKQGDKERLDYPTQKPIGLLERVIGSACPDDGTVLDPFCGCGSTVYASQRLKRHWIGIDVTYLAIGLITKRLSEAFGLEPKKEYVIIGAPEDVESARALALQDRTEFEHWALGQVGAVRSGPKKGADKGIDGKRYFHDEKGEGKSKLIVVSVKSGSLKASEVRDLRGVMEREKATIGVLVTLERPSKKMLTEAAEAGFYASPWGKKYPRMQILTVDEILAGKLIDSPPSRQTDRTVKRAGVDKPADTKGIKSLFAGATAQDAEAGYDEVDADQDNMDEEEDADSEEE